MARRGLMTALQAALAGAGGVAQGLVVGEERKRKRFLEDEARKRQDLMDTISLMERGAFEAGPIATRAPVAPAPMTPATQLPPTAIPLPTQIAPEAMQQAQAQQARYETGGPGAMSVTVGGRNLVLPSAATLRGEQAQTALNQSIAQARALADVNQEYSRAEKVQSQLDNYNTLKALGAPEGKRKFEEGVRYDTILNDVLDRRRIAATRAASAGRTPETMAAFIDKQVADEVARRVAAGKPLSPTDALLKKTPQPYTATEIQTLATELRQGLTAAFAPAPASVMGATEEKAPKTGTEAPPAAPGTPPVLDLSPSAAAKAGVLDTGKAPMATPTAAPAAAPKAQFADTTPPAQRVNLPPLGTNTRQMPQATVDSINAAHRAWVESGMPAEGPAASPRRQVPGATAPLATRPDTVATRRNLVSALDTAAVRRGEEIGMPGSAIRRPAPAPRYRPVLENPMSPEGIGEIPMPETPSTGPVLSQRRQRVVADLLSQRERLLLALQEAEQSPQFGAIDRLNIQSGLYHINRQLRNFGVTP